MICWKTGRLPGLHCVGNDHRVYGLRLVSDSGKSDAAWGIVYSAFYCRLHERTDGIFRNHIRIIVQDVYLYSFWHTFLQSAVDKRMDGGDKNMKKRVIGLLVMAAVALFACGGGYNSDTP